MITILGNLRINNLSRLEHMKESFMSFDQVSDNWVLNIRGTFREEAISFLRDKLGDRLILKNLLDDNRGWITNALDMLEDAKYDFILVWNEDHINIAGVNVLKTVVSDMAKHKVDYLTYTWWLNGEIRRTFDLVDDQIGLKNTDYISYVYLTKDKWKIVKSAGYPYYLISMCGIFNKNFLKQMWLEDQKRLPTSFKKIIFKILGALTKTNLVSPYGHKQIFDSINRHLFFNKIRKYPKQTPFEMEKSGERIDVLPLNFGLPKQELFACIDDDLNHSGYSLISRGLYKKNVNSKTIVDRSKQILAEIQVVLSNVDEKEVDVLVNNLLSARKIIASGAGRVGMAVRGFVMRLKHLGLDAYILGDANVPSLKAEDLFLVCSGSGETQTIYELVLIAQKNQAQIALVTGNPESRMAKIAHSVLQIKAPSKVKPIDNFVSIQPMTTLNEQSLTVFFDALVLRLMEELNETHDTMWARHSNLE